MREFIFAFGEFIIMNLDKIFLVLFTIPFLFIGINLLKRCFICLSSSDKDKDDELL